MDDSPLRRGRPSAHIAFGEAAAVLSGDALLTEAFALLGRSYSDHPAIGLRLVQLLGEAADSRHLIAGQVVDTLSEATVIDAATLEFIHQHKTADLIRAACLMGLSLSDHPPEAIAVCDRMGAHLGLAFQIIDDLLDATADESTMGKSVGTDARNHKNTYVSLHGLEACRAAASHHSAAARKAAQALPAPAAAFLSALIDSMEFRAS
jgi:geranylgeranyl diphosphate synthase type II